jgi:aminodeoxyfutalosine deaminase
VKCWTDRNSRLDDYARIRTAAMAVARSFARQGIVYAELHFSPSGFIRRGLEIVPLVRAIRQGLDSADLKTPLRTRLILDVVRDAGEVFARGALDAVAPLRDELDLVAIGLGDDEPRISARDHSRVFSHARQLGLRTVAHAGEFAGEDVRRARKKKGLDRVKLSSCAIDAPQKPGTPIVMQGAGCNARPA